MCAKELVNSQHEFGKINDYFPRRTLYEMGAGPHWTDQTNIENFM
jgi:hypothetical protein